MRSRRELLATIGLDSVGNLATNLKEVPTMSNGDLANRTLAAINAHRDGGRNADLMFGLLVEWVKEAPLLGNLHRSRALNGRLMDDQRLLIGALQVGIQQASRFPNDGPLQTFVEIASKRIEKAIPVEPIK